MALFGISTWKSEKTEDLKAVYDAAYRQGYRVVLERVDEEKREFYVSVYRWNAPCLEQSRPVYVNGPLDDVYDRMHGSAGLKILKPVVSPDDHVVDYGSREHKTEKPDGVILFSEMQIHTNKSSRMIYIWFDPDNEAGPEVITRVGDDEYRHRTWAEAIHYYEENFGQLDVDPDYLKRQMQEAKQKYDVCKAAWKRNRVNAHG